MRRFYALHGHWHAKRQGKIMNEIRSASEPRMKKALIYARFSTDLQNERSIEDQITLCKDYASRANIDVIDVYEDRARSGGSIMGRDGLLRLMDRAKDGSFDIVVVEALDRLSRDMEDLAGIHKRLSFLGIEIRAVHEGVVNTVLVGYFAGWWASSIARTTPIRCAGDCLVVLDRGSMQAEGPMVMRQLPATRASEQLSKPKHRSSGEFLRSTLVGGLLAKLPTT